MNARSDTVLISRHGWDILIPLGILTIFLLLITGINLVSTLCLLFFAFLVYLHRNPERISNYSNDGSILSPVDGHVKSIRSIDHSPIDQKPGFEVVIESFYTDTAVLRAPIDGEMTIDLLERGAMLMLNSPDINLNEHAFIRFSSKVGDVLVHHTLGSWARPLKFGVEGKILQNHRYGFMLNGQSVIYLPSNSRVGIKEGMTLRAGESVVGFFSETA